MKNKIPYLLFVVRNSSSGFTLVETLIVLGVIVVFASMAGLNLVGVYHQRNLNNYSSKIAYILRAARDKSINQENADQWGVHFDNSSSSFALFQGGSYNGGVISQYARLSSDIKFVNPSSGSSLDIVFGKITGLPSSTSSVIISLINNINVSSTITINSNGEISY